MSAKSVSAIDHNPNRFVSPGGNSPSMAVNSLFAETCAIAESGGGERFRKTTSVERSSRIGMRSLRNHA
jgi:hypothetical protein